MGSKPKASEYKASEAEKISASVAKADHDRFKQLYDPLLKTMREASKSTDPTRQLRGRANADTMQALTSNLTFSQTQDLDASSGVSQALQGQLGMAGAKGKQIENQAKVNVLGTARGQAADAASGMASAADLETSNLLNRAAARQQVRMARDAAAGQVAGSLLAQGLSNMSTQGSMTTDPNSGLPTGNPSQGPGAAPPRGTFFAPVNSKGQRALGIVNRLNYSGTLNNPNNPFSPFGGGG